LGGYAISIVCNIGLNAISDAKKWRWQISIFAAAIQVIAVGVLSGWPNSRNVILGFYFLTFATAAWGYVVLEWHGDIYGGLTLFRYALIAWMSEILRKEPEVRGVLVAIAVTLTCELKRLVASCKNIRTFANVPFIIQTWAMQRFLSVLGEPGIAPDILSVFLWPRHSLLAVLWQLWLCISGSRSEFLPFFEYFSDGLY